jgi:predicted RNA-binding protein with PIN domain
MTLIIDGHNLIPKVPGMQLSDLDDEVQLIQLVQEYCRRKRVKAELFFDGAPAGSKPTTGGGMVHVHYVRKGKTADSAMIEYVTRQGKTARNCIVVSSDRQVQSEARAVGSTVVTSDQFAAEMMNSLSQIEVYSKEDPGPLEADEVDKWLKMFNQKGKTG